MTQVSDLGADTLTEAFEYLDGLRESGVTNMFGAGAYIERDLGHDRNTARAVLTAWMGSFSHEDSIDERVAKTLAKAAA